MSHKAKFIEPLNKIKRMDPRVREAFLVLMDGDSELVGACHVLNSYVHCYAITKWLIQNRIVGNEFTRFIVHFGSSMPRLVEYVVHQINSSKVTTRKS